MVCAVIIKGGIANNLDNHRLGNNRDFNFTFDLLVCTVGGNKDSSMLLLAYRAYRCIGSLPDPLAVGVHLKADGADQILVGSSLGEQNGIANALKRCLNDLKCAILYLELNAGVGCLCGDLMLTNDNTLRVNDGKANKLCELLLAHTLETGNLIFDFGKCFVCKNLCIFNFNGNDRGLDDIGSLCFANVVGIVNFKVVAIFSCIGIVLVTVPPSGDLYVDIRCIGGLLTLAVVSKVGKNIDLNRTSCYVNDQLCRFEDLVGLFFDKAYVKGSSACVTNGDFGMIELPCACCIVGKLDIGKLIPIGRLNCGKRGSGPGGPLL